MRVHTRLIYMHALGLRPFGVSILYAGYDPHYQFQLYHSDPSGNYSGWKATCIGANNGTAQSLLKQQYKDDIGIDEAWFRTSAEETGFLDGLKAAAADLQVRVLTARREKQSKITQDAASQ